MSISFYAILLLFLFLPDDTLNTSDKDEELWRVAKKDFARRTREYLQKNPISDELRSFIEDLKQSKRRKRQDYHHNMYAIKDGMVVPLEELEESLNKESDLGENFTVVPLIIPIPLVHTVTHKERVTTEDDEFSGGWSTSNRPILGRGQAIMMAKHNKEAQAKLDSELQNSRSDEFGTDKNKGMSPMAEPESGNSRTEETVIDNLIDDKLKSTTEGPELSRVLDDVQNLINAQKKGKSNNGALCNVSGYWDSEAGGVTFHLKKINGQNDEVQMKPREPPSEDGFIPLEKWNVTARIPFQQSAQVIVTLTANKGRRVALFLGECRICEGSETITGDWLIARTSSGCKDQKASHSFLADVFRKNNVEKLREAHIRKLAELTTSSSTSNSIT